MSLCSLCLSLPFNGFPSLKTNGFWRFVKDGRDVIVVDFRQEDFPDPIGFPYHENMAALAESAKTCPLCAVVQHGVREWLDSWNKVAGSNTFIRRGAFSGTLPVDERLWLTEKQSGIETPHVNDGFCVWAMNPSNRENGGYNLYMLMVVGFGVEEDSPLKNLFCLRPVDPDSGSLRSLDRAATLVQNCVGNHQQCSDGNAVVLPSRVLDVKEDGNIITLLDKISIAGRNGKYACLSYCWGDSPPFKTTRATIQSRQSGIHLNEMPQTFKDAVTVTRRLGLRYLWIDSLCICQDDYQDWAHESGRMADVYSNAYVVIAANRSSDSTGGCFHKRAAYMKVLADIPLMRRKACVHAMPLSPAEHWFHSFDFDTEPLSSRGWALQERTLAQRILHYNNRQIYFECACGIEAEDGHLRMIPRNKYESSLTAWYNLVIQFSRRELSKATDKLPAMSGWAKKLQEEIDADYIAGLWSNDLIYGLSWSHGWVCVSGAERPASLEEYTGPSWSWTNCRNVQWDFPLEEEISRVVDWHVEPKEPANLFGEVRDTCYIRMHGPVAAIKQSSLERYLAEDKPRAEMAADPEEPISETELAEWFFLDFDHESYEKSGEWRNGDLRTILLGRFKRGQNCFVQGLVFKGAEHAGQRGGMERVGYIRFWGSRGSGLMAGLSWETITLV